jgi:nucleotide-binding universal stress UspA family protein
MPFIIAATDFSEVAENAIQYACKLAAAQNAQVNIIHSFIVPVMFSDIPMPGSMINDAQNDAESQMNSLVEDLSASYPQLTVRGKVIYGDIINAIEEYTEEYKDPWMIVVGNSIASESSTWPDSTLIDAFRNLKYPVLAVPPAASYRSIRNICFAFDNKHNGNDKALKQLAAISQNVHAELHVLNAQPDVHNQDNNTDFDENAKKLLEPVKPRYHVLYESNNVDQAIETFIEQNNMDWLIMIPRKHSFFEGLFHKSHTKSVAHHSHIPILALHETKA